jgi:hypothetical protein
MPGTNELEGIPAGMIELRQKELKDIVATPLFKKRNSQFVGK